jgi:protein-tyrosine phosphatase
MAQQKSILFVCLGNICRSPLGEGIFRSLVEERGLIDSYVIESCGTGSWHVGSKPHKDSIRIARENGIDITGQRARQLDSADFKNFDLLVAMDRSNKADILALAGAQSEKIVCLREFDPRADDLDVPDPYYGGWDGFIEVFDIVSRSCVRFLDSLEE